MAKRKGSRRKKTASRRASQSVARVVEESREGDFASEYGYVVGDLKRIGVLAASMFGALLVLALIIR